MSNVIIIVGGRNTGKTTKVKKLAQSWLKKGLPVFVCDNYDSHPAYEGVPFYAGKRLPGKLMYRHLVTPNGPVYPDKVTNALIILEDASKYLTGAVQDAEKSLIFDSKQKKNDLVFLYHSWNLVPPTVLSNCNTIIVCRCGDSPEIKKQRIPSFPQVMKAYADVMSAEDRYKGIAIKVL